MNIAVACKIVPDDQDVRVEADHTLDFSKAHDIVSTYDLNALEAAAQFSQTCGESKLYVLSVGGKNIDNPKIKKNILARGADELLMIADDATSKLDSRATAAQLAALVKKAEADLILTGDGSADLFARQTGVQLASLLEVPYVSSAISMVQRDGKLEVKRLLEKKIETVLVTLPAVISIAPGYAEPRIAGMKDILAAGKKPSSVESVQADTTASVEEVALKAPQQVDRKQNIFEDIDEFSAAVKAAL